MPPPKSIKTVLMNSPMLSAGDLEQLFPSAEDKKNLAKLATELEKAIKENQSEAEKWETVSKYKETALVLLKRAFGITF